MRVCSQPGCPTLIEKAGKCKAHARPNANARGYDVAHRTLRAKYQRRMDRGIQYQCWRCGTTIDPQSWDLGHDDADRSQYRGPECIPCNRGTASRISPDA